MDHIVVVDTGSTDNTIEVASKYADLVESFTECNENSLIVDFAMARNHAFSLAKHDWVMWADADDVVHGAEHLSEIIAGFAGNPQNVQVMFPYEYAHDANGNSIVNQYRERLVYPRQAFNWVSPVHECLIPLDAAACYNCSMDDLVFVHHREGKGGESTRNLRILENHITIVGETDARQLYYIGLEYGNAGQHDKMIHYLSRYLELSGWDEEKYMACIRLAQHYLATFNIQKLIDISFVAIGLQDNWGEAYLFLSRAYYCLAVQGKDTRRNWERCISFARKGLSLPPTKTVLFVNPNERDYEIHKYLNVACNAVGDVAGALDSCNTGLAKVPDDGNLLTNKRTYEAHIARHQLNLARNKLADLGHIDEMSVPWSKIAGIFKNLHGDIVEPGSHANNRDIVFYIGNGIEPWTPESMKRTGMGGSEIAACEMARLLAGLGNRVRVYGDCLDGEGVYDFVEYYHHTKFHDLSCDVLIVSRQASALEPDLHVNAKLKLLWTHDIYASGATNRLLLEADRVLALSQWHKDLMVNHHNLHPSHIIVTRNGINTHRFEKTVERNQFKCINSSSPDRSLPVLLDCWADIKASVPQAELHLFYGFKNWEYGAQFHPGQPELIERLKKQIAEMAPLGVVFHDRVNQEDLANEFLSAGAWIFPTWFTETSCIGAMEAQAAGLQIVTSNLAALKETVGDRGVLLDGEWTSPEYKEAFIAAVVAAMKEPRDRLPLMQYAKNNMSWETLAVEWQEMFDELIELKASNPVTLYQPSRGFNDAH